MKPPPSLPVPRWVPEIALPPYAFVPGHSPHPVSDPRGHSFGKQSAPVDSLDPAAWHECRTYLFGIDLFNFGYYWESHESWEGLWHACGRSGTTADFLKGLIKLAAAGVKEREGKPEGVKSHAGRAAELWRAVAGSLGVGRSRFLGLNVEQLIKLATDLSQGGWPKEPVLLLPSGSPDNR